MASENPNIKVIGGINLSLVLEILNSRSDNDDFENTIEESIEMSKEMIVFGNKLLNDVWNDNLSSAILGLRLLFVP